MTLSTNQPTAMQLSDATSQTVEVNSQEPESINSEILCSKPYVNTWLHSMYIQLKLPFSVKKRTKETDAADETSGKEIDACKHELYSFQSVFVPLRKLNFSSKIINKLKASNSSPSFLNPFLHTLTWQFNYREPTNNLNIPLRGNLPTCLARRIRLSPIQCCR